jgi:ribosomal protein S18 acetylase RimI-like enzyme
MPDLKCIPISHLDGDLILPLMEEEEKVWMSDLRWDYSPVQQILLTFIKRKLLPGYVAIAGEKELIGYTYFLINQAKGIIGALFVSKLGQSQEAVEELLSLAIACLKDSQNIKRVEAQIMPFNNVNLTATFTQHGFGYYPRYYLNLDLNAFPKKMAFPSLEKIVPWDSACMEQAAEMTLMSYRDQIDAEICEDYRTKAGCDSYLRSLVENPGCGIFMPEASFMALDAQNAPCGLALCCRISNGAAMIPQIAVHPSYQGRSLGNALMLRSFEQLRTMGFQTVSLTVTKKNRRAFDWYQRLGFRIRKEFGAYVWER